MEPLCCHSKCAPRYLALASASLVAISHGRPQVLVKVFASSWIRHCPSSHMFVFVLTNQQV